MAVALAVAIAVVVVVVVAVAVAAVVVAVAAAAVAVAVAVVVAVAAEIEIVVAAVRLSRDSLIAARGACRVGDHGWRRLHGRRCRSGNGSLSASLVRRVLAEG